jgi:hypothetical protein
MGLEILQTACENAECEWIEIVWKKGYWTIKVFKDESLVAKTTDILPNNACYQIRDKLRRVLDY